MLYGELVVSNLLSHCFHLNACKICQNVFGKLENEIQTYTISWHFVKTASDKSIKTVVFQIHLGAMINCRNCFSQDIVLFALNS